MLGPFSEHPFDDFLISPMMSRPKTATKRRVIIDLSWNEPHSLNANVTSSYDGTEYMLRYPSLDLIQQKVLEQGTSACLFKIDIFTCIQESSC